MPQTSHQLALEGLDQADAHKLYQAVQTAGENPSAVLNLLKTRLSSYLQQLDQLRPVEANQRIAVFCLAYHYLVTYEHNPPVTIQANSLFTVAQIIAAVNTAQVTNDQDFNQALRAAAETTIKYCVSSRRQAFANYLPQLTLDLVVATQHPSYQQLKESSDSNLKTSWDGLNDESKHEVTQDLVRHNDLALALKLADKNLLGSLPFKTVIELVNNFCALSPQYQNFTYLMILLLCLHQAETSIARTEGEEHKGDDEQINNNKIRAIALLYQKLAHTELVGFFSLYYAKMATNSKELVTASEKQFRQQLGTHQDLHNRACEEFLQHFCIFEHCIPVAKLLTVSEHQDGNYTISSKPNKDEGNTLMLATKDDLDAFLSRVVFARSDNFCRWWLTYADSCTNKDLVTNKQLTLGEDTTYHGTTFKAGKQLSLLNALIFTGRYQQYAALFTDARYEEVKPSITDLEPELIPHLAKQILLYQQHKLLAALEADALSILSSGNACPNWKLLKNSMYHCLAKLTPEYSELLTDQSFAKYLYLRPLDNFNNHHNNKFGRKLSYFGNRITDYKKHQLYTPNDNLLTRAATGSNRDLSGAVDINDQGKVFDVEGCRELVRLFPEFSTRHDEMLAAEQTLVNCIKSLPTSWHLFSNRNYRANIIHKADELGLCDATYLETLCQELLAEQNADANLKNILENCSFTASKELASTSPAICVA